MFDLPLSSDPGLLKAESSQILLPSLGSSSADQAISKQQQQHPEEQQQLYRASGPGDSLYALGGPSSITASMSCSSRTTG